MDGEKKQTLAFALSWQSLDFIVVNFSLFDVPKGDPEQRFALG